jgi:hypothetical protein
MGYKYSSDIQSCQADCKDVRRIVLTIIAFFLKKDIIQVYGKSKKIQKKSHSQENVTN